MKRFHHILAILLLCPLFVHAQGDSSVDTADRLARLEDKVSLGEIVMECIYDHTIDDPIKKKTKVEDMILEIGKDMLRYSNYGTYRRDSVLVTDYPDGRISVSEFYEISDKYGSGMNELITDLRNNSMTYYHNIFMDNYNYEEPIPQFDWTITEEEEELCGYACRKATTSFRGRDWTAWFAEDIPVNRGPWKFNGLPGLILKMEDSKKEHIIEAYQIRQSDRPFWRYTHSTAMKTDRLNFNKMLTDYMTNPGNFIVGQPGAPMGADGKPAIKNRRRFFNPIELE